MLHFMARGGGNRATSWLREHFEPVLLGGLVVAMMAFVAFAWFNQPKPAEYVPFTPAAIVSATPTPTPTAEPPLVTFIGDSTMAGSAMNSSASTTFPALLAAQEGFHPTLLGSGAIGYLQQDPATPNVTMSSLSLSIPADSKIIVFFGGSNDAGSYDDVKAAAVQAFANAKAIAPSAAVVVYGPHPVSATIPSALTNDRNAVRDAAADAGVAFVDTVTQGWFTEGNTALIGSDGVNPTDAGHQYLAEKISVTLAPLVTATLAAK